MHRRKYLLVVLILLACWQSPFDVVHAAQPADVSGTAFQKLQDELRKEKHRKKVLSRFEVVEGLRGLTLEDISLTLLDYSYHILNDSGRPEPFVTIRCNINISRFEKEAENLKTYLKSTGRQAPIHVGLPDSERIIVGVIDNEKDELITFASLPKSVRPVVKFAELRKKKPEYMIITMEPGENCTECESVNGLSTAVMGFDEKNRTYYNVLDIKTYRRVDAYDALDTGSGYIDKSTVSWGDWINNEYRELIVSTEREILGGKAGAKPGFKNKKEIYTWVNDRELSLVERIVDGKSTMSRKRKPLSARVDVTLKEGELYEMSGKEGGNKITSTNGKINEYQLSPDKHYVGYSIIVGYTNDAGLYEEGEKIPQVPVCHIVVMDLELKKKLTEIKPQSENELFINMDRWISNDELLLYDADGIAVGWHYIYNAGINELRRADFQEMNL